MGHFKNYEKKEKEVTLVKKLVLATLIVFIIIFSLAIIPVVIKHEDANKTGVVKEKKNLISDTLHISADLRNEQNLDRFINNYYSQYKILEYKHIDSEYSSWNGVHNFYEFILIKK